jgi:lipopolysaccharide transport system permease protein
VATATDLSQRRLAPVHEEPEILLERTRGVSVARLRELWSYRELLYFLTLRDIKVRYRQSLLGVLWAILQPVLTVALFTVVFGHVAKVSTQGVPYPIFSYSAMLPWLLFATSIQLATPTLVTHAPLITKVYFPRIFIAVSPVLAGVVDFALGFVVLAVLMAYYGIGPDPYGVVALLPLFLVALATTTGVAAWLSALNVKYRDIRFAVPFLVQLWFFATPVVYSIANLKQPWQTLYALNPLTGVVETFRWALAGAQQPPTLDLVLSGVMGTLFLIIGSYYFLSTEKSFADVV